jgi:polyisoprenoid-binding protein YceI
MIKIIAVTFLAIGTPSMLKIKATCTDFKVVKQSGDAIKAEVDLDSCDTGISLRNKHMKEKYLDIAKFPKATFSGSVTEKGVEGIFSIHGVDSKISGSRTGNTIEFSTKVSNHKIEVPSFLGVTVADEVKVQVEIQKDN